jgi:hypothetical protein
MNIHKAALASLLALGIAAPAFAETPAATVTPPQTKEAVVKSDAKAVAKERHQTKHAAKQKHDGAKSAKAKTAAKVKSEPAAE